MIQIVSTQLLVLGALVCVPLFYLLKERIWYHPFDKIPGPRPSSWVKGHFLQVFGMEGWSFHAMMAHEYGPTSSFHALFGERQLYTFDPKAIHYMLVKDDKSYDEPPMLLRLLLLIFGPNVMSTTLGHQHRKQRKILNPAFSLAHMKDLTPTIFEIGHKLQTTLTNKVKDQPQEIDILSWMGRTALEMIGQGGLGYSFDSMAEQEKPHPFAEDMKRLFPILARLGWAQIFILPYAVRFGTPKLRKYIAERFPWKDFQDARAISNSMWEMSKSIYEDRKRSLSDTGTLESGKDVLSLMIRENLKASGDERLEEEEMIGQMATLIFAGTDTTSSALTRMLEVLAQHPDAQHKLRDELRQAFEHGDPSYDDLVALPYLDSVIRESLRMYPSVSKISRTTTQDTILPLSVPVRTKDGTIITEIPIMKNTEIQISIMNMNRNPNIWGADADNWKPERWLKPLPKTVMDANLPGVYSNTMSFSAGERSCIGFKFSILEIKVVLALLIRSFTFAPTQKTVFWNMTNIASPMVKDGGDDRPQLPLLVGLAQGNQ